MRRNIISLVIMILSWTSVFAGEKLSQSEMAQITGKCTGCQGKVYFLFCKSSGTLGCSGCGTGHNYTFGNNADIPSCYYAQPGNSLACKFVANVPCFIQLICMPEAIDGVCSGSKCVSKEGSTCYENTPRLTAFDMPTYACQ